MTTDFDASPFTDLLRRAKTAFLVDSFYAVKIAEDHAALETHEENRANPEQVTADVVRLFQQGASAPEIARVMKIQPSRVRDILAEHGLDGSVRPSEASRVSTPVRGELPAPRPVTTRYVEPTKKLAEVPEKKRPEGIGPNRPSVSKYADNRCPDDHRHGQTMTCFDKHKCRCTPCIDTSREKNRRSRGRRI